MTHTAPVLMMVHAHPDDESSLTGGTLARYGADGCRTVLVTCTDGRQGDAGPLLKPGMPGHDPHLVAATRSLELDVAATALGVRDVIKLGYPDSGVAGEDASIAAGGFSVRPLRPMVTQLVRLIRMFEPDVLVTYPPNGLSGHPDHIRTHEVVVAAHENVAQTSPPGPRLYYMALSRTRLRGVQERARAALGADTWVPPDEMAIDDAEITTTIDVAAFWPHKLRALAAHASQSDAAALSQILGAAADSTELVEQYVRVYPTPPEGPVAMEHDFFGPSEG